MTQGRMKPLQVDIVKAAKEEQCLRDDEDAALLPLAAPLSDDGVPGGDAMPRSASKYPSCSPNLLRRASSQSLPQRETRQLHSMLPEQSKMRMRAPGSRCRRRRRSLGIGRDGYGERERRLRRTNVCPMGD